MMQLVSMFICNCNIALHVSDAFCVHLQEHLETVEAASGRKKLPKHVEQYYSYK